MKPYSADLRQRVLADCDEGEATSAVASKYRVSESWVRRLKRAAARPARSSRSPSGTGRRRSGPHMPRRSPRPSAATPTPPWRSTAPPWAWTRASPRSAGDRRPGPDAQKKSLTAAERDRPDVVAARRRWRAGMPGLDPECLVFVDETRASTAMTRARGRSASGVRLTMPVPHGHWKTTTFVAALRADGLTAPTVVDGRDQRRAVRGLHPPATGRRHCGPVTW